MLKTRLLLSITALSLSGAAFAQVNVPTTAQSGRASQQLKAPVAPPQVDLSIPAVEKSATKGESAGPSFTLTTIEIKNSTVFSQEQLQAFAKPYIGRPITLNDLAKLADEITVKYRNAGYILSRVLVPAQEISGGKATLVAVEGFVSNVIIQPEKGAEKVASSSTIKEVGEAIMASKPLKMSTLERNLLLVNDLPGVQAKGVVKASANVQGGADLIIVVSRKRLSGYVEADNRGSRYIGPVQFMAGATVNNVIDENDSASVRLGTTAQTREMRLGELSYQRTLMPNGLNLRMVAGKDDTQPGYRLKSFDVKGKDDYYSAQLSYPLLRSRSENLKVYGTLDGRDTKTEALNTQLSADHIRAARVGATWNNADSKLGVNDANVQLSQGINGLGSSSKGNATSRPAASPDFTKLNATLSREQFFRGSPLSVFGALSGQYATGALYAAEEFGLGGETFGSAYDPSELTGDSGAALRLEGRYTSSANTGSFFEATQPYLFYDFGVVHNRDPGVGLKATQSLASAGGGVRLDLSNDYAAAFEVAKPISKEVAALNFTKSPRVFFKVSKSF